jgi:hypothetical protein
MLKITNKQVKVHTDFYDFMPRWKLEAGEYEKATIKSIDEKPVSRFKSNNKTVKREKAGDLGEPLEHWPRLALTEETIYYEFLDKVTDQKTNKFYPARDHNRIPTKGTGACRVITDLIRLKTGDSLEFLLSKGYIIGHDAAGEEVSHYLPRPEMWVKTLFSWTNEYNNSRKSFDKICLGPSGTETIYLLEFNKENAKELFEQRANDLINFIVKDEISQEARRVEPDVNSFKSFERFTNNTFDYLWSGEYIPAPVRQELRQEAVARGYIKGGSADYQVTAQPSKAGKTTYG